MIKCINILFLSEYHNENNVLNEVIKTVSVRNAVVLLMMRFWYAHPFKTLLKMLARNSVMVNDSARTLIT